MPVFIAYHSPYIRPQVFQFLTLLCIQLSLFTQKEKGKQLFSYYSTTGLLYINLYIHHQQQEQQLHYQLHHHQQDQSE